MQPMPKEVRGASASAAAEETLQAVAGLMLGDALRGDRLVVARPEMKAMEWELSFEHWLEERCRKLDPSTAQVAACLPALQADSPSEVPSHGTAPLARSVAVAPPAARAPPAPRAPAAASALLPPKAFSAAPLRFRVPLQEQTRLPQTQVGALAPKAIAKQPASKLSTKHTARARPRAAETPHAAGHRATNALGATQRKVRTGSPTIDFKAQKRTIANGGPKPSPAGLSTDLSTGLSTGLSAANRAHSHLPMRASTLSNADANAPRPHAPPHAQLHAPPRHSAAQAPRFDYAPAALGHASAKTMLPPTQWGLVPCASATWRPAAAAAWAPASLPTSPEA